VLNKQNWIVLQNEPWPSMLNGQNDRLLLRHSLSLNNNRDWRNLTLYTRQLDFSSFAANLDSHARSKVWYM
jgi:hypothetical protein